MPAPHFMYLGGFPVAPQTPFGENTVFELIGGSRLYPGAFRYSTSFRPLSATGGGLQDAPKPPSGEILFLAFGQDSSRPRMLWSCFR